MRNKIIRSIATFFGVGYLPIMSGTFASLAGVVVYLLIRHNPYIYLGITALLIIAGFIVSNRAQAFFASRDPHEVVIDEVCGMLITYMMLPHKTSIIIIGFFLFRLFDIVKIYPINRLERLNKGWGIMLDDIAAGVFANIILQVIVHLRIIPW